MDNQITYLFGAGASRNALPIVTEIPGRIEQLITFLELKENRLSDIERFDHLNIPRLETKRVHQIEMIDSLKWMLKESSTHASIDTYAKKLYIRRKAEDLIRLKIAMSVFFIFEQARNKPDYRYDAFYASLIDKHPYFPENVRILSWNYDYQFELAYSEYSGEKNITNNLGWLRVKSKYAPNDYDAGFGIFKLNGSTSMLIQDPFNQIMFANDLTKEVNKSFIEQITSMFVIAHYTRNVKLLLSFAWEKDNIENGMIDIASKHLANTDVLVVIGYSFPYFNRDVDRKIIGNMLNLKKVYFQAPDADILKERFTAIRDDIDTNSLITRFDTEQFLLPNEL